MPIASAGGSEPPSLRSPCSTLFLFGHVTFFFLPVAFTLGRLPSVMSFFLDLRSGIKIRLLQGTLGLGILPPLFGPSFPAGNCRSPVLTGQRLRVCWLFEDPLLDACFLPPPGIYHASVPRAIFSAFRLRHDPLTPSSYGGASGAGCFLRGWSFFFFFSFHVLSRRDGSLR